MKLSDMIENYINEIFEEKDSIELRRNDLAVMFHCVPSQINYVISTRFIPELGFYVESRRGGGGYIKIMRKDLSKSEYMADILNKLGSNLSQSVVDVYLDDFIRYNILDESTAILLKAALSDKSLVKIDTTLRDSVRADMFKSIMINLL